jgi:fumarate hydratase subunit beta
LATFKLAAPLKKADVQRLRVKDTVYLSGVIFTARDRAHLRLVEYAQKGRGLPVNLEGAVIYHSGPLVRRGKKGGWELLAAGPTTSSRLEALTPPLLEAYGVRMLVGKGGMGREVAEALKRRGAVYCHFTGGAAVLAAERVQRVEGVKWLDLGIPEALWKLRVENFGPLTVTIDAHGNSLYEELKLKARVALEKLSSQLL